MFLIVVLRLRLTSGPLAVLQLLVHLFQSTYRFDGS
jgi:hypothetical protein